MVDWLRSKTPAVAVEVNNDQEANQFLEENQVTIMMIVILVIVIVMLMSATTNTMQ